MNFTRILGATCAVFSLSALGSGPAFSQEFPDKPIRIIVSTGVGSAADQMGRIIGARMSETLGRSIIVEAKPGANTIIATEYVKKAAPDGYTILLTGDFTFAVNPHLYANLPYSAQKDFVPISKVVEIPMVLAVNPSLPVKSISEFIAYAKQRPSEVNYGSTGRGSPPHLPMAIMEQHANIKLTHVPYKGSAETAVALMANEIQVAFAGPVTVAPYVKSGRLRVLGITTAQRSPAAPDVPTISESGLPGFEVVYWQGLFAPANTPGPIVAKLHAAVVEALSQPKIKKQLIDNGFVPVGSSSEELQKSIKRDEEKWSVILKKAGIGIESK
jgi:tripartite-type tricarboxylate transporter receptor subunit TctC